MKSNSSRGRPSSSTIRPSSTRTLGCGSKSDSIATRPFSGHSSTKPSRFTGRFSRTSVRLEVWTLLSERGATAVMSVLFREQVAGRVDLGGLAGERGAGGRVVRALEPGRHLLELRPCGGARAQRVVHREHLLVG